MCRKRFLERRAARIDGFDTDEEEDEGSSRGRRAGKAGGSPDGDEADDGDMVEEDYKILADEVEGGLKVGNHKEVIHFLSVECKVQGDIKPRCLNPEPSTANPKPQTRRVQGAGRCQPMISQC